VIPVFTGLSSFTLRHVYGFTAFTGRMRFATDTCRHPGVERWQRNALEFATMTFSAPSFDFDDGLVHSHNWSRNTPPGGDHREKASSARAKNAHDHDDGLVHEHGWARN
jgi:hypothetical protein